MPVSLPVTRAGRLERPDGASIAYEVTGEGPALVFAHGLGGNMMSWWQQIPAFADRHTCVAFSHRGFAPSTVPGGTPDPRDYAGDAEALFQHLGIDTAVLVCQSMGGWTGVETALANPARLAGLVLAGTTGSLDFDAYGDAEVSAWRERAPGAIAALADAGIHRATGREFAADQPTQHALYCAIDRLSHTLDKEELRRRIHTMRARAPQEAARIACPVLCVSGEDDLAVAPAGMGRVAGQIPDARFVSLPATGHSTYFERPALFNAIVARFLDEIGWR